MNLHNSKYRELEEAKETWKLSSQGVARTGLLVFTSMASTRKYAEKWIQASNDQHGPNKQENLVEDQNF